MSASLSVSVTVDAGGSKAKAAVAGLDRWLSRSAPIRTRGTVSIAIVSDRRMQSLNLHYRKKNVATDVLSFPSGSPRPGRKGARTPRSSTAYQRDPDTRIDGFWGDIAVAAGVAARQARDYGHSLATEFRILALHGLLHLLGYDHEVDKGLMGRVEDRLRKRGGLPSGLVARAGRGAKTTSKTRR
jgi:probable rRNA maturation factor